MGPHRYRIIVSGTLGEITRGVFEDLCVESYGVDTGLTGELDQAGLYGVLDRIQAFGLELVALSRLDDESVASESRCKWPTWVRGPTAMLCGGQLGGGPLLAKYAQSVGYRRSPGLTVSCASDGIGLRRILFWSAWWSTTDLAPSSPKPSSCAAKQVLSVGWPAETVRGCPWKSAYERSDRHSVTQPLMKIASRCRLRY
jgi:hypothetical protein